MYEYLCKYIDEIDKYWGTPAWTEHTRDGKYWKKHAEAFILQWSANGWYDDDDDDDL